MFAEFGSGTSGKTWHCETVTATGTWTKNTNAADLALVELQGGGQAGATAVVTIGGAGGAAGERVCEWVNLAGTSSLTVTIGAGGASSAAHGAATTFGALLRAMGSGRETNPLGTGSPGGPHYWHQADEVGVGRGQGLGPSVTGYQHPLCYNPANACGTNSTGSGGGAGQGTFFAPGGAGGAGGTTTGAAGGAAAANSGAGGGGGGGGTSTPGVFGAGGSGIAKIWTFW